MIDIEPYHRTLKRQERTLLNRIARGEPITQAFDEKRWNRELATDAGIDGWMAALFNDRVHNVLTTLMRRASWGALRDRAYVVQRAFALMRAYIPELAGARRADRLVDQVSDLGNELRLMGEARARHSPFFGRTSKGVVHPCSREVDTIWRDSRQRQTT